MAVPGLPGLKEFLNIGGTTQDEELSRHLVSARGTMRHRVGPDESTAATDSTRVLCGSAFLPQWPVISITSATGRAGEVLDISSAEVDPTTSEITGIGPRYTGKATILYQIGFTAYPDDLELATYIVAGHLWETQRGRTGSWAQMHGMNDDTPVGGDASFYVLRGFALPRRAMELIEPYRKGGFA